MSDFYVGQILWAAFLLPPANTLPCEGQLLDISKYEDLFRVLRTTFGGNGVTNFGVPDLRGRTPMGAGKSPDLKVSYALGDTGGEEAVTLAWTQVPAHNHVLSGTSASGITSYTGQLIASTTGGTTPPKVFAEAPGNPTVALKTGNIGSTGDGGAHNNMQPFLSLSAFIVATGIMPPGAGAQANGKEV